jgi:hypothetical protein
LNSLYGKATRLSRRNVTFFADGTISRHDWFQV